MVGRPSQFSGVVGSFTLDATAEPTTVRVEQPITLRVTIQGQGPVAVPPRRENLKLFPPGFDQDFYVEPVPEDDRADPARKRWDFVYRLRPRCTDVHAIAGLKLVFFDPGPRRYETAYLEDDIPITVQVPPTKRDWDVPDSAPDPSFYRFPDEDRVLVPPATAIPGWVVIVAFATPWLIAGMVWGLCRGRAAGPADAVARRALQALEFGSTSDPWHVVYLYLRDRLGYAGAELLPADVGAFLRRRGAARPIYHGFEAWLAACDRLRYAHGPATGHGKLHAEAASLIRALEADPCLRS